jgi:hypothetical protein
MFIGMKRKPFHYPACKPGECRGCDQAQEREENPTGYREMAAFMANTGANGQPHRRAA